MITLDDLQRAGDIAMATTRAEDVGIDSRSLMECLLFTEFMLPEAEPVDLDNLSLTIGIAIGVVAGRAERPEVGAESRSPQPNGEQA